MPTDGCVLPKAELLGMASYSGRRSQYQAVMFQLQWWWRMPKNKGFKTCQSAVPCLSSVLCQN